MKTRHHMESECRGVVTIQQSVGPIDGCWEQPMAYIVNCERVSMEDLRVYAAKMLQLADKMEVWSLRNGRKPEGLD